MKVENGWVTLTGEADWWYQEDAVEQEIRLLHGVVGLSNQMTIKPRVNTATLSEDITHALHRLWFFNPDNIHVKVHGGKVVPTGTVHSAVERQIAGRTAWSAPGATNVENDLAVL